MSKTAFLKEKTDKECRSLAAQYYIRARNAERALDGEKDKVRRLQLEICRLQGLAQEMLEAQ